MKKKKPKKPERFTTINIRLSIAEKRVIKAQAKKFAKNKLSCWLRIAGMEFEPPKPLDLTRR